MTLEEFHLALEEIAGAMPQRLFERLNGGVNIREEALLSPDSVPEEPRYILGQYHHYRVLGRWIDLYYGSFARSMQDADKKAWREQMDKVLRHELRPGKRRCERKIKKKIRRIECAIRIQGRNKK